MFQKNIPLRSLNTFGIAVTAKQFLEVTSLETLKEIVSNHKDLFILSGGSNILLTKDIDKPVLHLNTKGIEIVKQNPRSVWVKAQAGEIGMSLYAGVLKMISAAWKIYPLFPEMSEPLPCKILVPTG